jgi:butyryl-CoA dehydrogenase
MYIIIRGIALKFDLTPTQEESRAKAREFAQKELRPIECDIDKACSFSEDTVKKMGELGFMGMFIPKEYGGAGLDVVSYAIAIEEISRVCASHGVTMSVNNSLACHPINKYGNHEQKLEFLLPLASGEKLGGFGLTEPSAGTDVSSLQTNAIKKDDGYEINGQKVFITNGSQAKTYVIFAQTNKELKHKGITAFVMNTDTPGFSTGTMETTMGIHGSVQCELNFDNMILPEKQRLGDEGDGFKIAMNTLDGGRIGIASQALGIAQRALDESIEYAKTRKQFNKPIGSFQAIQHMLADMATEVEAARLLVYQAAFAKDTKPRYSYEASLAKLYAAEVAMRTTTKAVQIHGAYGYTKRYPVERLMRDAKITEIYEGTSEVQRMVIAAHLDKLEL